MTADLEKYNELAYYTLNHPDPAFIHQHVVDAFAAQTASKQTKPVRITFALVGLYLAVEKGFTGKQVQLAHMRLGKHRKHWLTFPLPENRGSITVSDVLAIPPGQDRDAMIHRWCACVWDAYQDSQQKIRVLLDDELGIV